jgi:hypothetical protein
LAQQPVLELVDVLVLVDGHEPEPLPVPGGQAGVPGQQHHRPRQQVVQVDQVELAHGGLVPGQGPGNLGRLGIQVGPPRRPGPLAPHQLEQQPPGLPLRAPEHLGQQLQPLPVVGDPEPGPEPQRLVLLTKDAQPQPVEGRDQHPPRVSWHQVVQPFLQLGRGPPGEGDCQAPLGRHPPLDHQMRQPVGQGPRLPRPRPRHHQQRSRPRTGGNPLFGVEPGEHPRNRFSMGR